MGCCNSSPPSQSQKLANAPVNGTVPEVAPSPTVSAEAKAACIDFDEIPVEFIPTCSPATIMPYGSRSRCPPPAATGPPPTRVPKLLSSTLQLFEPERVAALHDAQGNALESGIVVDPREEQDTDEPDMLEQTLIRSRSRTSTRSLPDKLPPHGTTENFSGAWVMRRAEGDFDGFLKECGVGWALRRAAGVANFGTNCTFHTIEHTKDDREHIRIITKNPKGTYVKACYIDGTEQKEIGPEEKLITVVPTWDGNKLKVEAFDAKRVPMPLTLRYMEGDEMVVEQISLQGIVVRRIFKRHVE